MTNNDEARRPKWYDSLRQPPEGIRGFTEELSRTILERARHSTPLERTVTVPPHGSRPR
ncbi:hypothetical protein ACFFK0_30305 [Paenibacillus chartarius]|uniref:Uncharacterized protein n=1 Tax=Paenibacillus chartarius TaxID=747481 RepID=A0ABV6DVP6_9BACL